MCELEDADSGEVGDADAEELGVVFALLGGVKNDRLPPLLDLLGGVQFPFRGDADEIFAGKDDLLVGVVATLEAEDLSRSTSS